MREILIFAGGVVLGATVVAICGEDVAREIGLDEYILDSDNNHKIDTPKEEGFWNKLFE